MNTPLHDILFITLKSIGEEDHFHQLKIIQREIFYHPKFPKKILLLKVIKSHTRLKAPIITH